MEQLASKESDMSFSSEEKPEPKEEWVIMLMLLCFFW